MSDPRRTAFTLIELMIAISLGLVLIYTAAAGFRVASQSITISNRLSLENELMRTGISLAHEHLDFWTNLDDPNDASRQTLRGSADVSGETWAYPLVNGQPGGGMVGLPFTPFTQSFPAGPGVPRATGGALAISGAPAILQGTSAPSDPSWEQDIGFDPTYAWAAHDPRTWFRGNVCEKLRGTPPPVDGPIPPLWFGRYGIFSNTETHPSYMAFANIVADPLTAPAPYSADYTASVGEFPQHLWYGRQLRGLSRALGFYGTCDYLPSNVMYGCYGSYTDGTATNQDGMASLFLQVDGTFVGTGMLSTTLGIYGFSHANSFGVTNPYGRTDDALSLVREDYRHYASDYNVMNQNTATSELSFFIKATLPLAKVMDLAPAQWPVVSVAVGHFLKSAHFVNMAKVRWVSPLTGQLAELSFTSVGTTLRGARMQRRHPDAGAGWARWDNGSGAVMDRNLDSP